MPVPPPLGILAGLLAAGLLLAPTAVATPSALRAPTAARDCPGRDLVPTADDLGAVRAAIVCLHSQIRAERGLPSLAENAALRRAATAHSTDMVASDYFEHTGPSGTTSWTACSAPITSVATHSYRDVGVGIVIGVPSDGTAGATFTADFGGRR